MVTSTVLVARPHPSPCVHPSPLSAQTVLSPGPARQKPAMGLAMMMGSAMAMGGGLSFTNSVKTPQLSARHQFDPFQTPFQL